MKIFKEYDSFSLSHTAKGQIIGECNEITLPIGIVVTVVLVHGDPEHPNAYEVEAYLPEQDCYVLATLEADNI